MEAASLLEVLKRFFGYASFRHSQARVIRSVLDGRSALLVSATGFPPLRLPRFKPSHIHTMQVLCGRCRVLKARQAKPKRVLPPRTRVCRVGVAGVPTRPARLPHPTGCHQLPQGSPTHH